MKLIKFTDLFSHKPIYINPEFIGHIYEYEKEEYGKKEKYTIIGTTCHNNGGFRVTETPEKIFKLLNEAKPFEFKK